MKARKRGLRQPSPKGTTFGPRDSPRRGAAEEKTATKITRREEKEKDPTASPTASKASGTPQPEEARGSILRS